MELRWEIKQGPIPYPVGFVGTIPVFYLYKSIGKGWELVMNDGGQTVFGGSEQECKAEALRLLTTSV